MISLHGSAHVDQKCSDADHEGHFNEHVYDLLITTTLECALHSSNPPGINFHLTF